MTTNGVFSYNNQMGKLLFYNDVSDQRSKWYFDDAYFSTDRRGYIFKWPSPNFPIILAINEKIITNSIRCSIRKWIEEKILSTVITDTEDKSYRVFYGQPHDWERSYDIPNYWCRFHFEDEKDALLFKITFAEYIKPITDKNPYERE